jgi:hypothetical protein
MFAGSSRAAERSFKAGGKVVTADREAVAAANKWLAKVDTGNYRDAWDAYPSRIKRGGTTIEEQYVGYLKARRAPLGPAISRSLFRARFSNTLAGSPDGNYEFLDYRTSFERKKEGFEIVTLTKESGHWQVSGYRFW